MQLLTNLYRKCPSVVKFPPLLTLQAQRFVVPASCVARVQDEALKTIVERVALIDHSRQFNLLPLCRRKGLVVMLWKIWILKQTFEAELEGRFHLGVVFLEDSTVIALFEPLDLNH
jgi:hypothetical protein